jgi:patched domain-containing protein
VNSLPISLGSFLGSFPLIVPIIGRFGRVIITAKGGDDNLLRTAVWKELRMLDDIIQNTTTEFDGDVFSYRQICARWEDECFTNDILNLDYILPEVIAREATLAAGSFDQSLFPSQVENGNLSLSWPIMLNPVSWDGELKSRYG